MADPHRRLALPMIVLGVAGLLASRHMEGPMKPFLRAHGANVSFSFAAVFLISRFLRDRIGLSAVLAFAGLTAQEFAQKFGLYPGMFDPWDLLWNAAGVGLALTVVLAFRAVSRGRDSSVGPRGRSRPSP